MPLDEVLDEIQMWLVDGELYHEIRGYEEASRMNL